ncbi:MAG: hypothetical protein GF368_02075 [Candidatus Aenigmarchaeota archaeon]|nr:hypothetical protein [Candidatus Aenigmarchaeota archaeon]
MSSSAYSEDDSLVVDPQGPFVAVRYCKPSLSGYDSTVLSNEPIFDEKGNPLYTGFSLMIGPHRQRREVALIAGQISVHPDHRRQGLGGEFLSITEGVVKALGYSGLSVEDADKKFFGDSGYTILEDGSAIKKF